MTIACLEDDEVEGIRKKGLDRAERVSYAVIVTEMAAVDLPYSVFEWTLTQLL